MLRLQSKHVAGKVPVAWRRTLKARQPGFTLVEMMVAMVVSLVASAAMLALMANTLGTGTQTIETTRMTQEMRTALQLITRDLRRSNYLGPQAALTCFRDVACLTTLGVQANIGRIGKDGNCFWFWLDRNANGAFEATERGAFRFTEASGIGFGAMVKSKQQRSLTEAFKEIEPEDLIKFGLIPELVGRVPVIAALSELSEDALVEILTEPKNAVVKQFSRLLAMEGAELEVRPAALKAIARKALARKTGARGLRSILENALIDTMFDLPGMSNVEKVVVDESTIDESKPPLLVYREAAKQA